MTHEEPEFLMIFVILPLLYMVSRLQVFRMVSRLSRVTWVCDLIYGALSYAFVILLSANTVSRVYLSVKTCEVFHCFVAIVMVRSINYVDFFVFFVLHLW